MRASHLRMMARDQAADRSVEPEDTGDLVARAAGGDRAAFHEIVRRYHVIVHRWAAVSLGDRDEADDVVQLVLLRMHAGLSGYRGEARFTTWLYRITRNVLSEIGRTRIRRRALLDSVETHVRLDKVAPTSDAEMDSVLVLRAVTGCVAGLPPRQREVFELADIHGYAPGEIAEFLDMEAVTVRTNLLKARRAVREKMLAQQPKLIEELRT